MFACASAAAEQLESEFVLPVSGQSVEGHPKELMTLQVPVKLWAPHGFTMGWCHIQTESGHVHRSIWSQDIPPDRCLRISRLLPTTVQLPNSLIQS